MNMGRFKSKFHAFLLRITVWSDASKPRNSLSDELPRKVY